jgi:diguanylate cyclase (GGDEF)-like protein
MRRALPQAHLTDRRVLWHSAAGVLAVGAVLTAVEMMVSPAARDLSGALSGLLPAIGAVIAWWRGPWLTPRASYRVGRIFLVIGSVSTALSVENWRGTPVAGAMTILYVLVVLFAAVFFSRRDVYEQFAVIGALHALTLLADGFGGVNVLSWLLTMLGVVGVGMVMSALVQRMDALSFRDPLTGAANRRSWDLALVNAVDEHRRSGQPLSVALIDIDHFKAINDSIGHDGGDRVLERAVRGWLKAMRASDVLARLGGDEFAVLLPSCDAPAAQHVGHVLAATFLRETGATCSIGAAAAMRDGDPTSLFALADEQLYHAKHAGRACVRVGLLGDDAPTGEGNGHAAKKAVARRARLR